MSKLNYSSNNKLWYYKLKDLSYGNTHENELKGWFDFFKEWWQQHTNNGNIFSLSLSMQQNEKWLIESDI